jgi:hypothetical protein
MSKPPHFLHDKENKRKKGKWFLYIQQYKKILLDILHGNYAGHCKLSQVGDSMFSIAVFWVETSCNLEERHQRFEGIYCLHLLVENTSTLKFDRYVLRSHEYILPPSSGLKTLLLCSLIKYVPTPLKNLLPPFSG